MDGGPIYRPPVHYRVEAGRSVPQVARFKMAVITHTPVRCGDSVDRPSEIDGKKRGGRGGGGRKRGKNWRASLLLSPLHV